MRWYFPIQYQHIASLDKIIKFWHWQGLSWRLFCPDNVKIWILKKVAQVMAKCVFLKIELQNPPLNTVTSFDGHKVIFEWFYFSGTSIFFPLYFFRLFSSIYCSNCYWCWSRGWWSGTCSNGTKNAAWNLFGV